MASVFFFLSSYYKYHSYVHLFFRDVSKFAMHFIVEEIDEDTSMEELQKMMLVALVYRILVCFYEVSYSNCNKGKKETKRWSQP